MMPKQSSPTIFFLFAFGLLFVGIFVAGCTPKGVSSPIVNEEDTNEAESGSDGGAPESLQPEEKTIRVEAFQYGFSPDPIVVKKGERVKLIATTRDVSHGFSLPVYGVDERISPGEEEVIIFTADTAGTFPIQCTVPCGSGHSGMKGTLVVEE